MLIPFESAIFFLVMVVFMSFVRQRTHFLIALLALELVIVFIITGALMSGGGASVRLDCAVFIMLAISACEASLGLAVLVLMVRTYGNDSISALCVNKP